MVKVNQGPTASPTYGAHLNVWVKALLTPLFPVALCVEVQLIGAWLYLAWCQEPRTATIQVCVAGKRQVVRRVKKPPSLAFLICMPTSADDSHSLTEGARADGAGGQFLRIPPRCPFRKS